MRSFLEQRVLNLTSISQARVGDGESIPDTLCIFLSLPPPSARDTILMLLLLAGPARMLGPRLDSDPDVPGLDGKPDNSALA